jgi:23S rRNA pseudouridine2605 synthase
MERLQKILSQAGVASRRASEQLMLEGRVTLNGVTVRELGTKADPAADDIRVDGRRIRLPEQRRYLLLNKPRGYVTTRSDPQRRPTVLDLLGGVREYVYPVGRLDFDSEGLLLLTNDGELAAHLTHPSHGVARVYEVRVAGIPDPHDLERLARGVTIDGRRTEPAQLQIVPDRVADRATVRITIHEGRNRQVRRMFDAIGHPVDELRRVAIGPIRDTRLKPGAWRDLSATEVSALKRAAQTVAPLPRTQRLQRPQREVQGRRSEQSPSGKAIHSDRRVTQHRRRRGG